ncbi:hypothetical protein Poli38472_008845 [Pythium oligandrum]|uniref:CEP76 C2 domain-containing protein n=1 Tax=Pythium oligandrum TaxID=41045 RepID=A0A8K1C486_PYTOL|nr:hypothetical protein Poli38472_008845 [Pythium oligandrum]|eukprot:TMW56197.1 hypothetical protein Poli38472_008845 [Pythium oligandrum]
MADYGENGDTNTSTVEDVKVSSIRSAIDAKLHEEGVYQQIRELILHKAATKPTSEKENIAANGETFDGNELEAIDVEEKTEDHLIQEVMQSELVQQVLVAVRGMTKDKSAGETDAQQDLDESEEQPNANPVLYVRLAGGRAFVDQIAVDADLEDHTPVPITSRQIGQVQDFFRVIVSFDGQRLSSQDVRCSVDPPFDEHFRLRVQKKRQRTGRTKRGGLYEVDVVSPWEALCLVDEPLQILLIKVRKRLLQVPSGSTPIWQEVTRDLVATHRLDWRRVLCSTLQLVHLPVQLVNKMKVPVGTLDVRLDLLNFKRTAATAHDVSAFLNKEAMERNTLNHAFYRHAKEWWDEYRSEAKAVEEHFDRENRLSDMRLVRAQQRQRLVKLFAEDDDGRFRMVCKFLTTLRVPRAIRSPSEAARFVSLIPFESSVMVGSGADEAWRSLSTILAVGKGDVHDHAVLLASLLLGCGLVAYVCIGTISTKKRASRLTFAAPTRSQAVISSSGDEEGHVWVMTRGESHTSREELMFWESLTGERFKVDEKPSRHGFVSIDCIFSMTHFYANLQPRGLKMSEISFTFEDETSWKALGHRLIADLPYSQPTTTLSPPNLSAILPQEDEWTTALRRYITSQRRSCGLITKWSDDLSFFLLPALNSYEMERLYGVTQLENELFQQSIKRFVPEGCTFQGVPIRFHNVSLSGAIETLEENEMVQQILSIQGRGAQFGLGVRCFAYPENRFAIWVMLAVSYQSN